MASNINIDPFIKTALYEIGNNQIKKEKSNIQKAINHNSNVQDDGKPKIIHELNAVFRNSQIFSKGQLSKMLLKKNIYIQNLKPGDWFQMSIDNVENEILNVKKKNEQDPNTSISYLTTITEKFPRK
jgi:hypothetical protein